MMSQKLPILLITKRRQIVLASLIILFLFTMWLYFPPYLSSFIGDDFVQQWRIREFLDTPFEGYRIFNPFWTNWYYRPLQNQWFLGNRLLFDLNPTGYYYLQLAWHLLAIAMIFKISRRLGVGAFAAFGAAVLFSISGQHPLVVGWISSIGNIMSVVFSLAAVISYIAYIRRPDRTLALLLTLLFYFCALLAHEEGFILPIFLIVLRLLWPYRPLPRRPEILAGLIALASMILYTAIQIIRPNANLTLDGAFPNLILGALSPAKIGHFLVEVSIRWSPFSESSGSMQAISAASEIPAFAILAAGLLLGLFIYGILKGSLAIRLGLIWTALHLGFVYIVLWGQRPELFDSRHIYSAWAGLSLAFGGTLYLLYEKQDIDGRDWRLDQAIPLILIGSLIFIFFWLQAGLVHRVQEALLAHTELVNKSKNQLLATLPEITDSTRLFANRFILTAPYFTPTAAVWYEEPELTGGTLETLKEYDEVSPNFFLFDYADGTLYNLLPELQQHRRTMLLWRKFPDSIYWLYENSQVDSLSKGQIEFDTIVGPPHDRRLAIQVPSKAQAWSSIVYETWVPPTGRLATAMLPEAGQTYRITASGQDGTQQIIYESTGESNFGPEWVDIEVPFHGFAGQTVELSFDFRSSRENQNPGYWSNPRIVVD